MSAYDTCTRVPISEITTPNGKDIVQVYEDRYWVVIDEHVLLYRGRSPQCNINQEIVEHIIKRMYPGAECRLLELAFVPWEVI